MIKSSIFKSYDVRGIYPDQINENSAFQIGKYFVNYVNAKKVAVGYDARLSSPKLFQALTEGIISQGVDVYLIGEVPTECLYFAVANYDFDAGIMITASHNPKEYNGFKMILSKNLSKTGNMEMIRGKDLYAAMGQREFDDKNGGHLGEKDILPDYIKYMLSFVKEDIKPFKVVIDTSNGVMGKVLKMIKASLPIEIIEINFSSDGNFPNHSPNPLENGSTDQISKAILENKADFGFMFDGDADRVFLVDENGQLVWADITLLLLAKYFLSKNSKSAIAYNAICSKSVPEFIKKWGGVPIRTPVGFVNVREGLIKNNGVMGGELSGHYCFKDYFYMDSGMISFLTLLQVLSKDSLPNGLGQARKVSEIVKELSVYFKSAEINFEIENKEAILDSLKDKYKDGKQDFLDGVTVEYENWWFNVRPSNTEPLLRLTIEANTQELLDEKKKEISNFISK